jgi:hypothetical protein
MKIFIEYPKHTNLARQVYKVEDEVTCVQELLKHLKTEFPKAQRILVQVK